MGSYLTLRRISFQLRYIPSAFPSQAIIIIKILISHLQMSSEEQTTRVSSVAGGDAAAQNSATSVGPNASGSNQPVTYDNAVVALESDFASLDVHKFFAGNMRLAYSRTQGRYVVAAEDLPAGTVVLEQTPFAGVVSDRFLAAICSYCFGPITQLAVKCAGCKTVHYCSQQCMRAQKFIHSAECSTVGKLPTLGIQGETTSLRCVIRGMFIAHVERLAIEDEKKKLSQRNQALREWRPRPGHNAEDVAALMTHRDKFSPDIIQTIEKIMTKLGTIFPAAVWPSDGVKRATDLYLQLHVNAHHITDPNKQPIGLGLYAAASYMNHSCNPTCVYHFGPNGAIVMRTIRDVKKGEELSFSYIDLYNPSYSRRKTLKGKYFFDPAAVTVDEGFCEAPIPAPSVAGIESMEASPETTAATDAETKADVGEKKSDAVEATHSEKKQIKYLARYDAAAIIAEDRLIGGLKCVKCETGTLNYHVLKSIQDPPACLKALMERYKRTQGADESKVAAPEGGSQPASDVESPMSEAEIAQAKYLTVGTANKQPYNLPLAVTEYSQVRCDSCDYFVVFSDLEKWLNAVQAYFDVALRVLAYPSTSAAGRFSTPIQIARHMIEEQVIGLTTNMRAKAAASPAEALSSIRCPSEIQAMMPRAPPGSIQLAKLHPFHAISLNAYLAMLQVARMSGDLKLLTKYGQLALTCLKALNMANHPEAADSHLAVGDGYAWMGGEAPVMESTVRTQPPVIADPNQIKSYLALAAKNYVAATAIRANCYGARHHLTKQAARRIVEFSEHVSQEERNRFKAELAEAKKK